MYILYMYMDIHMLYIHLNTTKQYVNTILVESDLQEFKDMGHGSKVD